MASHKLLCELARDGPQKQSGDDSNEQDSGNQDIKQATSMSGNDQLTVHSKGMECEGCKYKAHSLKYKQMKEQLKKDIELWSEMICEITDEGAMVLKEVMDPEYIPVYVSSSSKGDYLVSKARPVLTSLHHLCQSFNTYRQDRTTVHKMTIPILRFANQLSECVEQGLSTYSDEGNQCVDDLSQVCIESGELGLKLFQALKSDNNVDQAFTDMREKVEGLLEQAEALLSGEDPTPIFEKGIRDVEEAASKFQELSQEDAKVTDLDPNTKEVWISCTELMEAVKMLLKKSDDLQKEIAHSHKLTASVKEFYKENHNWTEDLLSAAKAVGWAVRYLVQTADSVVRGEDKLEKLVVIVNEILTSSVHLVTCSKVKADQGSLKLKELLAAQRKVQDIKEKFIVSTEVVTRPEEEIGCSGISRLSDEETKNLKIELQNQVFQLEINLENKRNELAEFDKA